MTEPSRSREILEPSAMLERPGWLTSLFLRVFYTLRYFAAEDVETIRQAAAAGRVVYVVSHRHLYNALYFNRAFLKLGLPLARLVTGVFLILFQPFLALVAYLLGRRPTAPMRERVAALLGKGEAVMVCLRRGTRPGRAGRLPGADDALLACLDAARAGGPPVTLVPLHLFWGNNPLRPDAPGHGGVLRRLFGGHEDPGYWRSFYHLFRYFRFQWVKLGEPLKVQDLLASHGHLGDEALIERLRFDLSARLERVRRVVQGPLRKGVARIREEVLRGRRMREAITHQAETTQVPRPQVERQARAYLKEIAADPSIGTLSFLRWFLRRYVWYRVYDGIEVDEAGMERLRQAAARGPILFLPSHRSHVDYLLLSCIVSEHGVAPPCIAAGANLSFWPIGGIFRRSGAFFIRRTFWNNPLYTTCLVEYLRKILAEGWNVEFFIEGTRSRTGKVLMPRMGLLKWIAEAALEGRVRNVQVVPVSIGYEKVVEESTYTREAAGGAKKSEDMGELLKARRVLAARYGRPNFYIGQPYPLREALAGLGATRQSDEATRHAAITQLAYRVVHEIAWAAVVTPTSLVSAGLLLGGRRAVDRPFLEDNCRLLAERLLAVGARLGPALLPPEPRDPGAPLALRPEALDRALELLARGRGIELRGSGAALAIHVPDEVRPTLAYYRNGLINFLVSDSLVARAVLAGLPGPDFVAALPEVTRDALLLSRLFKHEFIFPVGRPFEAILGDTLERLTSWALVRQGDGYTVRPGQLAALRRLALLTEDFAEAYVGTARALEVLLDGPLGQKALVSAAYERTLKAYYRGELSRFEACNRLQLDNAVLAFKDLGVLHETVGKSRQGPPIALTSEYSDAASLRAFVGSIERLVAATGQRSARHEGGPMA
jgi:glycerol-3-phosphate O-acyltransferase